MPVLLKNALNEAVEMINFIKSQPWILLNLFNILCAEMGIMYRAFLRLPEASWLSGRKPHVWLFELQAELKNYSYADLSIWTFS